MSHAEALVLSRAATLERVAETLKMFDGLPDIEPSFARHVEGHFVVIFETLDAYEWANALHLDWIVDTGTGEVEFTGIVNGVCWSVFYLPRTSPKATNWTSPIHHTMVIDGLAS